MKKSTCLYTINKLPRRTAQQVPARRPGITTGFSQARSCHTTALSGCNQPHEACNPVGIHQMAPSSTRLVNKPTCTLDKEVKPSVRIRDHYLYFGYGLWSPDQTHLGGGLLLLFPVAVYSNRFYVHDADDKQTTIPLYEAWFHWNTGKHQMADAIEA